MNVSQLYILISIIVLAIIAYLVASTRKKKREKLSRLSALAFVFVLAGMFFINDRVVGYSFMGIGIVLSIIDIFRRGKGGGDL